MKDFQVVSALTQLKALVAGLYGRIDALAVAAAPTVDFAVDMFDRQDQDTLGPYWSNTNYAIRSNAALLAVGDVPVSTILGFLNGEPTTPTSTFNNYSLRAFAAAIAQTVTPASVVYQVDISSPDFDCVVRANVPTYSNAPPSLLVTGGGGSSVLYSHYVANGTVDANHYPYQQVGVGAGVCIANTQNGAFGVATMTAQMPDQTETEVGAFGCGSLTASTPHTVMSRVLIGSDKLASAVPVDPAINDAAAITSCVDVVAQVNSAKFNIASIGANSLTATCRGDNVSISMNGNMIFNGVPPSVSRKSRARAGIMTGPESITSALAVATSSASGGVTSFKVWRNDIPEPPNESGHGAYTNGRWQYTDKYHTPVTDEDGNVIRNEDGTVANYVYDPEA